jgi:hypothetical protein
VDYQSALRSSASVTRHCLVTPDVILSQNRSRTESQHVATSTQVGLRAVCTLHGGHVGEELGTEGSQGGRELEREGTREEGGCREGAGGTELGREGGTAPGRAWGGPREGQGGKEGTRDGLRREEGGEPGREKGART